MDILSNQKQSLQTEGGQSADLAKQNKIARAAPEGVNNVAMVLHGAETSSV